MTDVSQRLWYLTLGSPAGSTFFGGGGGFRTFTGEAVVEVWTLRFIATFSSLSRLSVWRNITSPPPVLPTGCHAFLPLASGELLCIVRMNELFQGCFGSQCFLTAQGSN